MIDLSNASLKDVKNKDFRRAYKIILKHKDLSPGQKVFLFAVLDAPRGAPIIGARIARKLKISPQRCYRWQKGIADWVRKERKKSQS